jgi:hypothetical protein
MSNEQASRRRRRHYVMGSFAVSTCKTSVFRMVLVSRTTSELGEKLIGDGVEGINLVTVVVVVVTRLFSRSSLPMSYSGRKKHNNMH